MRSSSSIRRLIGAALVALTLGGCAEALSDQQDDAATAQHQLTQVRVVPHFSAAQARELSALGLTELHVLALDGRGEEVIYHLNARGGLSLTPGDPEGVPELTLPGAGSYLMSLHAPDAGALDAGEDDSAGAPQVDERLMDGGINEGPQPIPFDPNDPGNKHDPGVLADAPDPATRRVISLVQPHPEANHREANELNLSPGLYRLDFVIEPGAHVR